MLKKILLIANVCVFAFLLFSCKKELKLSEDIVFNNLGVSEFSENPTRQVIRNNLENLHVIEYNLYKGILIVRNSENQTGVWSLKEGKLVVPLQNILNYQLVDDSVFGAYIKFNYLLGEQAIYDINGYEVLKKDKYYTASVSGKKIPLLNAEGIIQGYEYQETVSYLTTFDKDQGLTLPKTETYTVNVVTKQREGSQQDNSWGDYFDYNENQMDLEQYGLKGYYAKSLGGTLYVYKNESHQLINKIAMPNSPNLAIFDGQILYQVSYRLDLFTEEYTYIDNGIRYLLKTKSIDLLSGNEKDIKLDYRIFSLKSFKDENKIYKYAYVSLYKISSKVLNTEIPVQLIINSSGKQVADVTGINFNFLIKLDQEHVYDLNSRMMYDEKLNPLFEIPTNQVNFTSGVMIFQNIGFYGAINYDGKVVIPFEYTYLSNTIYDGMTFGVNSINQSVLINIDNTVKTLEGTYKHLSDGVLLQISAPVSNIYQAKIMNYKEEVITSLDLISQNYDTRTVSNAFGLYSVLSFSGKNGVIYISIV